MSDTETKPSETPEVRRGVALPRVLGAPPDDRFAPGAPEGAPRRARRRLVLLGGLAAVAVVAGAVAFPQFRPSPRAAPADAPGPAALDQAPPIPKWATSIRPTRKPPRGHPTHRTARPSATPHRGRKTAAPHWGTLVVRATYVLQPGASVRTNRISLGLTTGGDLVLRDEHGRVTWSSGTRAAGTHAVFQDDGNLAVYQGEQTVWSSRTDGHAGATLVLRPDGRVAIVWNGTTLWKAGGR